MTDALTNLMNGFGHALTLDALLFCLIGVTIGTLVGVLPGIGTLAAISLILPLTYYVEPLLALIMLSGIFYGTQYGGSITAILLNLPGEPSTAITCLDAHPMAKKGRAGAALFIAAIASFVGGSLALVLLICFTPYLAGLALQFSSADYFALILFCLIGASMLGLGSPLKGFCMVAIGLLIGMVGTDVTTGQARFTLGIPSLLDGIDLTAMLMGLFGVSEVVSTYLNDDDTPPPKNVTLRSLIPTRQEAREAAMPTLRGSGLGSFIGLLPGMGATLGTFLAYSFEKRISSHPEKFGKGTIEGIAAPEACNNATVQASFIPMLGIGIPSGAVMAVLMGAMMVHGIQPGPLMMIQHPDVFWGVVASMWVGNVMLLILNIPLIGLWVRLLSVPSSILSPVVLLMLCIGVYSVNNNVFDIYTMMIFGVIGYICTSFGYSSALLILGVILSPILEEHLRRSLLISNGDYFVFLQGPISATFIVMSVLVLALSLRGGVSAMILKRRNARIIDE
ncbi:tripartite tricarboxylate transporter permease [Chelativorans sp.]|uniref:tripartite tricarboxylate transporter permease n=1 Tax=Chelativorans sp. TaxID=2203393 RepID=UPI0028114021|nr:tripartite tricarboxylate transporter permease [Chelativorans sp.]